MEGTSATKELAVVERLTTTGDRVCQEVLVPVYDVTLYYGVVAVDKAGNKGAMSNIVRLTVASPRELQTDGQVSAQHSTQINSHKNNVNRQSLSSRDYTMK